MSKNVKVAPAPEDGQQQEPNAEMTEEQHKRAKHHWSHVRAEVKLGIIGKAMKNKKKIAAALTVKIVIIVVIVIVVTSVVAAGAAYKNQDKLCENGYTSFCPKPEPVANKEASSILFRVDICHTTKKGREFCQAPLTLCPKLDK